MNAAIIALGDARASAAWLFAWLTRIRVKGQLSGFAKLVSVEITPFTSVLIPITAGEDAQEGIVLGQTLGLTGTEFPFFPFPYSVAQMPVIIAQGAKATTTPIHFDRWAAARRANIEHGCLQVPLQRLSGQRQLVAEASSCLFEIAQRAHALVGYPFQIAVEVFLRLTGQLFERRQMRHLVWTGCLTSMCQPAGQPPDLPYPLTKLFN